MSILDRITDPLLWEDFFEYKQSSGHLPVVEAAELRAFIDGRGYLPVAERILAGESMPLPRLVEINKKSSSKKRTVFVFPYAENCVLKLIAYLVSRERDGLFSGNLYSFRHKVSVKNAIRDIISNKRIAAYYSYKVDIHDYFNSADTDLAVKKLRSAIPDDPALCDFIEGLLREPRAVFLGRTVECRKGIMAGVPISGFLANLYLSELDREFAEEGTVYARYSDDIIVFSDTAEGIALQERKIKEHLAAMRLEINEKKEFRTRPGEPWEFLGFRVEGRTVDVSRVSLEKIKAKMRRKAKALLRWKARKGASDEGAVTAFIRIFNQKLFENPRHNDITWSLWYFPTVTTDESLRAIDEYALSCVRFIYSGRHSKAGYRLRYGRIKELGFRSLVNAYYKFREGEKTGTGAHAPNVSE